AQAVAGYEHLLSATEVTDANAGSNRSTTEDTPLAIAGLSVDGDDPGDISTLRIQTSSGTSSLILASGVALAGGALGTDDFSLTGNIADINATLASLVYSPEANGNSATAGFNPSISVSVTNGGVGSVTVSNIAV